jgi:transcriptional regulator with XRE-family HTH domain
MEILFHLWHNVGMCSQTVGSFIRWHRKRARLTQQELAEVIQMTSRSVSEWETGRATPSRDALAKLAHVFRISLDEFKQFINVDLSDEIDAIVDQTPPDDLSAILSELRSEGEQHSGVAQALRNWLVGWRARNGDG